MKWRRYLKSDKSLNGHFNGGYWEGRLGAGMQYELSPVLRLDLQVAYNIAFDDGFDGYDYNTGSDPYLSTGIGIAYTFGDPEVKPMYSVRLFGPEYGGAAIGPTEAELAQADSSRKMMVGLFGQLEAMNQQMNTQSDLISKQQLVLAGQNDSIAHYNEKLKEQTQVINELRTELAHAKESGKENAEAPVTHWQKEQHQVQVYFDFDSDVLTPKPRKF
ncbi:MAG: hypothetical protein U5L96_17385 [Owenweeksia sp.]|nr:hypothetical protein [Owenweeksia sp.]